MQHTAAAAPVVRRQVAGSEPIAFYKVLLHIPEGGVIGHFYRGVFRVPVATFTWNSGTRAGSADFKQAATEELQDSGFDVLGADDTLFSENNSAKARYQLGATIKDVSVNVYDPPAGGFSEATVFVEWQLQDSITRKIILTNITSGYVTRPGTAGGIMPLAFRNALGRLIATSNFAELVARDKPGDNPAPPRTDLLTIVNPAGTNVLALPADMEKVLQGVVVLKAGRTLSSGFLVSSDGYILTAAHAVSGLKTLLVTLRSGLQLEATVVRTDELQDLALLKVAGHGHPCLTLKLDGPAPVGNELYAVGAPASEELSFSVTKGIVSGYRVREQDQARFIQTDASLNPGNSGGPLLDQAGRVIGIADWKVDLPGFEGLSFGVPMEVVGQRLGIKWVNDTP